jgi:aldehyde dehydrogenase (NAD+)
VGESIMRDGAATMKRVTLELGGKSPTILLDDAKLDEAIPAALGIAFMNSGQACAAGTRLLVPRKQLESAKRAITDAMGAIAVGDPADPRIAVGPMVSQKQYDRVQAYIRKGIEEGAEVLVGGEGRPQGLEAGYFVKPTVFVNVTNDMTIAREEIFGPVLSVIAYDSEDEAISIANDSKYGLHAVGEQSHLAFRIAAIGATGVGFDEFPDGEAIRGFLRRNGDVFAHPFSLQASRVARVSRNASMPYQRYSRPTPEYLNPPQGACGSSVMPLITTRPARN